MTVASVCNTGDRLSTLLICGINHCQNSNSSREFGNPAIMQIGSTTVHTIHGLFNRNFRSFLDFQKFQVFPLFLEISDFPDFQKILIYPEQSYNTFNHILNNQNKNGSLVLYSGIYADWLHGYCIRNLCFSKIIKSKKEKHCQK